METGLAFWHPTWPDHHVATTLIGSGSKKNAPAADSEPLKQTHLSAEFSEPLGSSLLGGLLVRVGLAVSAERRGGAARPPGQQEGGPYCQEWSPHAGQWMGTHQTAE